MLGKYSYLKKDIPEIITALGFLRSLSAYFMEMVHFFHYSCTSKLELSITSHKEKALLCKTMRFQVLFSEKHYALGLSFRFINVNPIEVGIYQNSCSFFIPSGLLITW